MKYKFLTPLAGVCATTIKAQELIIISEMER